MVTSAAIQRTAARLERFYGSRGERFGARIFAILRSRTHLVRGDLYAMRRARTRNQALLAQEKLNKDLVSLILEYQGASGGYSNTLCLPGTRMCCQPKRSEDLLPGEQAACKWTCVSHARACRGFLGPRLP